MIQRDASPRVYKDGSLGEYKALVLKRVGKGLHYVTLSGKFTRWDTMVADAWPDDGRPEPLYSDGRVLTVQEWAHELRTKSPQRI